MDASSGSCFVCWDCCTRARRFCLSRLEQEAASITELSACTSPCMFEASTCTSAGFLAISASRMLMARSRVSIVSHVFTEASQALVPYQLVSDDTEQRVLITFVIF